jgi:YidC/Oxa1 family membrane protein insertase
VDSRRFIVFLVIFVLVMMGNSMFQLWWKARNPPPQAKKPDPVKNQQPVEAGPKAPVEPVAEASVEPAWFTLGSFGDAQESPLLITLNNRGATIERVELNGYVELEDHLAHQVPREDKRWHRSGYLGQLAPSAAKGGGVKVNVVAPGTPAAKAGIKVGDVLLGGISADGEATPFKEPLDFVNFLLRQKPETTIKLDLVRADVKSSVDVVLAWSPAQVIRPESNTRPLLVTEPGKHDPLSLSLELSQINDQVAETKEGKLIELAAAEAATKYWEGKQLDEKTVVFTRELPTFMLRLIKRYQLLPSDQNPTGYELSVTVGIENLSDKTQKVGYQLEGPNGLPIEGWWYAFKNRISTQWFQALGLRDVAIRSEQTDASLVGAIDLVTRADKAINVNVDEQQSPLVYAGVDCQYFSAVLIPKRKAQSPWLMSIRPKLLSEKPLDDNGKELRTDFKLANVSCSLKSVPLTIEPKSKVEHQYHLFVGPKRPEYLNQVGNEVNGSMQSLDRLVYFGWYIFSAPGHILLWLLHTFHKLIPNYGINIIMLTIFVRLCLFPLSRKQALSAAKMQELAPELKDLKEKYKDDPQSMQRKTMELYRKHKFNPFGGCLLAFVQLPIFMGLYRALMLDVELRGAPLFSEEIRWCSNLGAPDQLFYWGESFLPKFLVGPHGYLGPYFNLLPLINISLFLYQQKAMLPPATDEQTKMQHTMMKIMTIFMGIMFFTVASGLCLYFIVSSTWGIMERKFLKTMTSKDGNSTTSTTTKLVDSPSSSGRRKERKRRK